MIPPRISTATIASVPIMAPFGIRPDVCGECVFCAVFPAAARAPAIISDPHFVQNFVDEASAAPHLLQNCCAAAALLLASRCAPHLVQKASRSVSAAPHCLQLSGIKASTLVNGQICAVT